MTQNLISPSFLREKKKILCLWKKSLDQFIIDIYIRSQACCGSSPLIGAFAAVDIFVRCEVRFNTLRKQLELDRRLVFKV
ncbi:unnamed protein product [Lactuca virosa]|uniref:Uncharacterized protein n=1 Tax=Lactuca virosa TaxID=75947 RepID=A0AAU9PCM5_9ASTR|nr:unnamed protein product [Lactuca virosa]